MLCGGGDGGWSGAGTDAGFGLILAHFLILIPLFSPDIGQFSPEGTVLILWIYLVVR